MGSIEKVQDEYNDDFCSLLEMAYGKGFLSEGGTEAIDDVFKGYENELNNKEILDIGCGYGGGAVHLAHKYGARVFGLEINQRLVDVANGRIPDHLKSEVRVAYYDDVKHLPFPDGCFDFAYSKEVLLHLDTLEKTSLMREVKRVLRPGSNFMIIDWLSPVSGVWGMRVQKVAQGDGLTLVAHTEEDYRKMAVEAGFIGFSVESRSETYAEYNRAIAVHLREPEVHRLLKGKFSDEFIQKNIDEYELLSKAMKEGELLIRRIVLTRS